VHIEFESPDQPGVRALIAELDAYLYAIYPAESVYALDIASLCEPNVSFAVLRDAGGAPVGCGALVMKPGYGEIKRVYVRPQARGRGLARRLMAALEPEAIAHGARTCMLETGPAQAEALVLYERLGYSCRGPFGDYPADPHSVFMEKNVREDVAT
jgi:putative acetyltransferase